MNPILAQKNRILALHGYHCEWVKNLKSFKWLRDETTAMKSLLIFKLPLFSEILTNFDSSVVTWPEMCRYVTKDWQLEACPDGHTDRCAIMKLNGESPIHLVLLSYFILLLNIHYLKKIDFFCLDWPPILHLLPLSSKISRESPVRSWWYFMVLSHGQNVTQSRNRGYQRKEIVYS